MWYVGVDVGGTHIDLMAINSDDGARSEAHHTWQTKRLPEEVAPQITSEFISDLKIDRKHLQVIGVGWKHARHKERMLAMVSNFAKVKLKAEIYWDAETAFAGALPERVGIVVVCGTGAAVYGRTHRRKIITSGGWSPLLGDPGSAFSIGQKALVAALRDADGVGEKTKLTKVIPQVLHQPLEQLVIHADAHMEQMVPVLASLAPAVFALAEEGDVEAVRIRSLAAKSISERIASMMKQWPSSDPLIVSYSGRMMRAQSIYRQMIQANLRKMGLSITWREPQFRPPYGAVLLTHPSIEPLIARADQSFDWHHPERG